MAYITETILQETHGSALVAELCPTAGELSRTIAHATARVRTALMVGGYAAAVPETVYGASASDCPTEIIDLAARVWKRVAYTRRDLSIPEDQIRQIDAELADIREGRAEIKGVSRSTARAPGGITGTDGALTNTATDARPQLFSRSRMAGF